VSWFVVGFAAVLLSLFVIIEVRGESMCPTLMPGDVAVAERVTRILRRPKPADIIVFRRGSTLWVKRVAGTTDCGVFVVGDNAGASQDSRHFGLVPYSAVCARVLGVWRARRMAPPAPRDSGSAGARHAGRSPGASRKNQMCAAHSWRLGVKSGLGGSGAC